MVDLMTNIKNLREISGAGFLDCKKALEENNNEIDKSIDYLRKKGLSIANKKSNREAKEGAIGIFSKDKLTVILQINTETDFAAKNDTFLTFVENIANIALDAKTLDLSIDSLNKIDVKGRLVSDLFIDIIAKIGENIILNKLLLIEHSENSLISTYIHNAYKKNIGKIGVVLKSEVESLNEEAVSLGKNLCMHIAASKPLALEIDQLNNELIEKEKEIQIQTIKSSGKPENIAIKILEGKMRKFYSESLFLRQNYILDPDKTVSKIISEFSVKNEFKIIDYHLLVLGS